MRSLPFLGGMTAARFLRDHWQKRPLLVRGAFPGFTGLLSPDELAQLACLEDAKSRIVRLQRGRWQLAEGPFDAATFTRLPRANWSLLVQGVNHFLPAAERLLQRFSFIPHARLDDLMISHAVRGGSVGPHFDSYDVFLLQGMGHRRWQISGQRDRELVEGAPLRILRRFEPEQDFLLGPGDLLYLPPRYAHHGVATDECLTCSIGFRAPSQEELVERFLAWLPDQLRTAGIYQDPNLTPARHPAEIGAEMVRQVEGMLAAIRWDRRVVARFVGQYLSEPKPHVFFRPPRRPLSPAAFARRARSRGVRLELTSLMLSHGPTFFINGEVVNPSRAAHRILRPLADERHLPPSMDFDDEVIALLHQWYRHGYLVVN